MLLPLLAFAAVLIAAPAAAVVMTSAPGAPDPGLSAGEVLVVSFDAPSATGVAETNSGKVITGPGSNGQRAAPAGTGTGAYRSIGAGGRSTFDFSGFTQGAPLRRLSFYWGSIDSYNHVDFLNPQGTLVGAFAGGDLPLANGNQTAAATNRRVFFDFLPAENVTAVRFRSTGTAFELDSIGAITGAVPEPATWAMLILGFGAVGIGLRRRRPVAA